MKTILVPTDFSAASLNAAHYAVDLAAAAKATVVLLHVCNYAATGQLPITAELITNTMTSARKDLEQLKAALEHTTSHAIAIHAEIREGEFIEQLKECCENIRPLLVIMGPHGVSAAESFFFGSSTISAMRTLQQPLIIVPVGTRFTGIHDVGIACDLYDIHHTLHAAEIKMLLTEFHPQLHILHVTTKEHGLLDDNELKGAEQLKKILHPASLVFHFIRNEHVAAGITEFAEKNNLSLLVVIPKNHSIIDSLLHKSHAKQVLLHTHIPLMSVHE